MNARPPSPMILETARTVLRPFELSDAEQAFEWFSDPEVMRFIPMGLDRDLSATISRISRYKDHQRAHGFSKWIIIERKSMRPIGDAGFFRMPDSERVELGYRFRRSAWRQGFATEVAEKWLEVAPLWFGFEQVVAFAHPENTGSFRVMEKLGFQFSHRECLYGIDAPLYVIDLRLPVS